MPIWEVVDGNRRLVKSFSSEDEAYQWVDQQNQRHATVNVASPASESLDNAIEVLRVAILGF
jgi:hypothetical protein